MNPSMPNAIIQNATRNDQRSLVTTLRDLVEDIRTSAIGSPAIMVVGETVHYAQSENTGIGAELGSQMAGKARQI